MAWPNFKSAGPACRSCSVKPANLPKNGPTATSPPPTPGPVPKRLRSLASARPAARPSNQPNQRRRPPGSRAARLGPGQRTHSARPRATTTRNPHRLARGQHDMTARKRILLRRLTGLLCGRSRTARVVDRIGWVQSSTVVGRDDGHQSNQYAEHGCRSDPRSSDDPRHLEIMHDCVAAVDPSPGGCDGLTNGRRAPLTGRATARVGVDAGC